MTIERETILPAGNRLLDSLMADERGTLAAELEVVHLEMKEALRNEGGRIDSVYFPLRSVVSLLNYVGGTDGVEVATIGNEGLVGVSLSWGAPTLNPAEQVQVPGTALRMNADAFVSELSNNDGLANVVHRYTQAFVSQLSQQVACNGLHSIEERCARWMLLTQDRVGADGSRSPRSSSRRCSACDGRR